VLKQASMLQLQRSSRRWQFGWVLLLGVTLLASTDHGKGNDNGSRTIGLVDAKKTTPSKKGSKADNDCEWSSTELSNQLRSSVRAYTSPFPFPKSPTPAYDILHEAWRSKACRVHVPAMIVTTIKALMDYPTFTDDHLTSLMNGVLFIFSQPEFNGIIKQQPLTMRQLVKHNGLFQQMAFMAPSVRTTDAAFPLQSSKMENWVIANPYTSMVAYNMMTKHWVSPQLFFDADPYFAQMWFHTVMNYGLSTGVRTNATAVLYLTTLSSIISPLTNSARYRMPG
jgi:hypothetical protein